jgi:hypothetical protein
MIPALGVKLRAPGAADHLHSIARTARQRVSCDSLQATCNGKDGVAQRVMMTALPSVSNCECPARPTICAHDSVQVAVRSNYARPTRSADQRAARQRVHFDRTDPPSGQ